MEYKKAHSTWPLDSFKGARVKGKRCPSLPPLRWNKHCLKLSRLQTYVNLLLPIAKLIPMEEICELLSPTANFALGQPHVMYQCQSNLTPRTICRPVWHWAVYGDRTNVSFAAQHIQWPRTRVPNFACRLSGKEQPSFHTIKPATE